MFGNAYQNGHYFQIWDSKVNNDKNQAYKQLIRIVPPSNKSYYDKELKSYIYNLETQNNKMIFPASDQKQLALHQKYLVLHIFIPVGSAWSMELGITDINGIKRRINFTTGQGKNQIKFFSIRYPLDNLERGVWLFLAINVHSFIQAFKSQVYRSLDHICVGSSCKLRRIFTMKQWQQWQIPKAFCFHSQIQQQFQLIQYRQLLLPKIGVNKSLMSEQSSPPQFDKLGTIKHSKSNLTRSEIVSKPFQKNSVISQSPAKSKVESSPKQKISLNSKIKMINDSKIRQFSKIQYSANRNQLQHSLRQIIQSKIIISSDKDKGNKNEQKTIKSVARKSPGSMKSPPNIQKSFQQDQALNYKPSLQSDNNFETSHQSFTNIKQITTGMKKYERWQAEQRSVPQKQIFKQSIELQQAKSNRTIITKQNLKSKIKTVEKTTQLQLIYDEMVGCYYHPQTHTYYQIKQ